MNEVGVPVGDCVVGVSDVGAVVGGNEGGNVGNAVVGFRVGRFVGACVGETLAASGLGDGAIVIAADGATVGGGAFVTVKDG